MKQEDAKKEAQRILHAPEAQQLLALLSRGGGQTLQQAAAAAQRGDMAGEQRKELLCLRGVKDPLRLFFCIFLLHK